jgi:outer membrane phospholipase A
VTGMRRLRPARPGAPIAQAKLGSKVPGYPRCGRTDHRLRFAVVAAVLGVAALGAADGRAEEAGAPSPAAAEEGGEPGSFNPFLTKLSPDEPLYIALGWRDGTNAKFQLSFKYRFVNPEGELTRGSSFFSRVYFGYTQTSLWDLDAPSAPFYDTSYRPSFFYRHELLKRSKDGRSWLWGQIGIEHESNGQGGDESRSLNTIYAQPVVEIDRAIGSAHLTIMPRLWLYVGSLSENPDIADYRGYGQLRLAVTGRAGWQIAATGRVGTSGKGSLQVDLTYPMNRLLWRSFDGFLYAQFFDGWSESLLTYDQRLAWQLRIGIAVVR